jgi:hypothetical protein
LDINKALDSFNEALELSHQIEDQGMEAESLCNMSQAYIVMGDINSAKKAL